MKTCTTCGMPLLKPEDCAKNDLNSDNCIHCVNDNGEVKSCAEICEGGVMFFMGATGATREEAEKLTRKNMKSLEYWKNNPCECLNGEEATDEEFKTAMSKMQK